MHLKHFFTAGNAMQSSFLSLVLLFATLLASVPALVSAQITPAKESPSDLYPGKAYSP